MKNVLLYGNTMKLLEKVLIVPNSDKIDEKIQESRESGFMDRPILLTFEELDKLQKVLETQMRYMTYVSDESWPHTSNQQITYRGFRIITAIITSSSSCDICTKNEHSEVNNVKLCETHYKVLRAMEKFNE